ncbi:hypothetical protein C8R43DRAFT_479993 [Mycena crocata]|nr:hypothetical protein C8R43DRAFT_479993 [Mycena crocata]
MAQSGAGTWMSLSTPTGPGRVPDSGAGTLGRRGLPAWDVPQETVLDCIEPESIDRLRMPQNFIRYAFSFPHRRLEEIRDLLEEWGQWDDLRSLANYHSVVKKLFDLLKDSFVVCTGRSHSIATEMSKKISRDVSLLHERLAAILCEKGTCKSFFACRGDLAQQLLDLSQDVCSYPLGVS